mmetsp:Transcript_20886/g.29320  ORF Transcript_20886/g.29320 Transcript_20886/m.29320 type:complete len:93 (-) Transcript_20886:18-296(-)
MAVIQHCSMCQKVLNGFQEFDGSFYKFLTGGSSIDGAMERSQNIGNQPEEIMNRVTTNAVIGAVACAESGHFALLNSEITVIHSAKHVANNS